MSASPVDVDPCQFTTDAAVQPSADPHLVFPPAADPVDDTGQDQPASPPAVDVELPPISSLGPDSDISVFMRPGVSAALRMAALTRVFHTAKFNQICLCAEYAEDYTSFEPLGAIVPHDMRSAIVREARRLQERWAAEGIEVDETQAQQLIEDEAREGRALPDDPIAAGIARPLATTPCTTTAPVVPDTAVRSDHAGPASESLIEPASELASDRSNG